MSSLLCIVGTDTDAGKTIVTAGILRALRHRGIPAQAIKAVQTGCEKGSDGYLAPDVTLYREAAPDAPAFAIEAFEHPCSPHLAARLEGKTLSAAILCDAIRRKAKEFDGITLVESAGGLLVPLNERECLIDLFTALDALIVLVSPNRLGTINHTLLSLEALRARGIEPYCAILCSREPPAEECYKGNAYGTTSLAMRMQEDNAAVIRVMGKTARLISLPFFPGLGENDVMQREAAWNALCDHLLPLAEAASGELSRQRGREDTD